MSASSQRDKNNSVKIKSDNLEHKREKLEMLKKTRGAYSPAFKSGRGKLEYYNDAVYGENPTEVKEVDKEQVESEEYRGGLTKEQLQNIASDRDR